MASKSKFSAGDRVWFTSAGPRFKQEGSVLHVRKDGLLFVHFDGAPPDTGLIVLPYGVDPISTKKRYEPPQHAVKKTPPVQLDREIVEALVQPKSRRALAAPRPQRGWDLTGELARTLPRFEFIAHWLAVVTRKKENRGPLGLHVKHLGKRWQVVSPIGGGTVTFETTDPALLFDYARRGQLGREIQNAEEFRSLAHEETSRGGTGP